MVLHLLRLLCQYRPQLLMQVQLLLNIQDNRFHVQGKSRQVSSLLYVPLPEGESVGGELRVSIRDLLVQMQRANFVPKGKSFLRARSHECLTNTNHS